ncbi:MAG TPA: hypothetical protein VG848_05040, partial [Acetobacteraceae bacterium]|nr:hypothetical protein [Acetobacteraceae bacterium]
MPIFSALVLKHHKAQKFEVSVKPSRSSAGLASRIRIWAIHELREVLPPTIFFFIGFNLIVLTTNLILSQYFVTFGNFALATAAALIVGKSVLVANAMPVLRQYDRAPLIQPILFKTAIYWAVVFVARLLEHFVRFTAIEGHSVRNFFPSMVTNFSWNRFAAIQIWILVLFFIYVTASELNHLFGYGELARILFTHRPSELQQSRRQRIHELIRLSRLADAHTLDEFRDPTTEAHDQLI